MKQLFLLLLTLISISSSAQPTVDYAVQTWAEIETYPPKITINWLPVNGADKYYVYRKDKKANTWGFKRATLDASTTFYVDTTAEIAVSYEYKIRKIGNVTGFGYINAGIEIPAQHFRGNMLLLIDSTFSGDLSFELERLTADLIGDGWKVYKRDINPEASVIEVKQTIVDIYNSDPEKLDLVFCFGHIPVPYSGNNAPDGHNNHVGAWPADGFYGEINGIWQDLTINNQSASQERNHNIPGDGKYDNSYFPSALELQVGRVDFSNMPAFSSSELELLRNYLDKDHAFRTAQMNVGMQAVIDDNFGGFGGEAFAASAWKSYAPLLDPENVVAGDYRTSMDTSSYIWSYGCGGGSFTSANGIGNSAQFAEDSLQGIFSCLFGSYFGDWDSRNNLLRASIARGTMLTNCWSGRPHWYFHHMGLGENIGYSTRLSMNNSGSFYSTGLTFLARIVSMGLMGDPTLRMHMMHQPSGLTASFGANAVTLNWTASGDTAAGYYIYRSDEFNSHYTLLNEEVVYDTSFTDDCIAQTGTQYYMVRAAKLQATPSGSYYNLSQGVFSNIATEVSKPEAAFTTETATDSLFVQNNSLAADSWLWDFGDGTTSDEFQPVHLYESSGDYLITLIASNACFSDTFSMEVSLLFTNTDELISKFGIKVSPNPVLDWFSVSAAKPFSNTTVYVYNSYGKLILEKTWTDGERFVRFSLKEQAAGIYIIVLDDGKNKGSLRLIKQ